MQICYILMSDKRTKFVLGTVITSIALVLAAASVLPLNLDSIVIQENQSLGLVGHFVIIAEDPDRIQYIQSDNIILADGLDVLGEQIFGGEAGTVFDQIFLSGDVAGAIGDTPSALFTNTGAIQGTYLQTATTTQTADCSPGGTTTCEKITGAATQVDGADATEIKSVALGNTGGAEFLAWTDLSPTLQVTPGTTTVTITYKIQLG